MEIEVGKEVAKEEVTVNLDDWLPIAGPAAYLRIRESTARKLAREQGWPKLIVGKHHRFKIAEVEAFLKAQN